jgi:hypothetical protein
LMVLASAVPRLAGQSGDTDLSRERAQAFRSFGSLGYPDVKDRPLIHGAEGGRDPIGDDPPLNSYLFGFLLRGGETFTVLTLDQEVRTFEKTPAKHRPRRSGLVHSPGKGIPLFRPGVR